MILYEKFNHLLLMIKIITENRIKYFFLMLFWNRKNLDFEYFNIYSLILDCF